MTKTKAQAAFKKREPRGVPRYVPTKEQKHTVAQAAAFGMPQDRIVKLIMNPKTGKPFARSKFQLIFEPELRAGKELTIMRVARSLVDRALDLNHPQGATCAIFYLKCQAGWRQEDKVVHEHEGTGVLVVPSTMTPEEWVSKQGKKNTDRANPMRVSDN